MDKKQVYQATVRSGRGKAVEVHSAPGVLDGIERLTGLSVIPGTFNIYLSQPFDMTLLKYASLAEMGWGDFDLSEVGIDYDGEVGVHWGRIIVADKYPACLIIPTWRDRPLNAEMMSPHHLRNTLSVQDGDTIEFTLVED